MKDIGMAGAERSGNLATVTKDSVTFWLGPGEYGIDPLKEQEMRGYESPTRIANAPAFIEGVGNLCGTIVPIVDLRLKFNCPEAECNRDTVVIILNLRTHHRWYGGECGERRAGAATREGQSRPRYRQGGGQQLHSGPGFGQLPMLILLALRC